MCNFDESFQISENETYNLVTIVQIAAHIACGIQQLAECDAIFSIYESCHTVQPKKAMNIWLCCAVLLRGLFCSFIRPVIISRLPRFCLCLSLCAMMRHIKKKRGKNIEIYKNNENVYAHTHIYQTKRTNETSQPANKQNRISTIQLENRSV